MMIPYKFVLPPEQNSSFVETLCMEGNDFLAMVSTLDMGKAEASSDYGTSDKSVADTYLRMANVDSEQQLGNYQKAWVCMRRLWRSI